MIPARAPRQIWPMVGWVTWRLQWPLNTVNLWLIYG
jgi:hypothetical protein